MSTRVTAGRGLHAAQPPDPEDRPGRGIPTVESVTVGSGGTAAVVTVDDGWGITWAHLFVNRDSQGWVLDTSWRQDEGYAIGSVAHVDLDSPESVAALALRVLVEAHPTDGPGGEEDEDVPAA